MGTNIDLIENIVALNIAGFNFETENARIVCCTEKTNKRCNY